MTIQINKDKLVSNKSKFDKFWFKILNNYI